MLTQQLWRHCSPKASLSASALEKWGERKGAAWNKYACAHLCAYHPQFALVELDIPISGTLQDIMESTVGEWVSEWQLLAESMDSSALSSLPSFSMPSPKRRGVWWLAGSRKGCYSVWIIEGGESRREGEICVNWPLAVLTHGQRCLGIHLQMYITNQNRIYLVVIGKC